MKSYGDITLKYLKKNKKRTLFTIIGMILSLSLISGIGFLLLSFNDYMYEMAITNNGDYEFYIRGLNKEQVNLFKNDVDLEKIAVSGKVATYNYNKGAEENKITIDIGVEDNGSFKDVFYKSINEGRFPREKNEIILNSSAKEYLGINIGDSIELEEINYDDTEGKDVLTGNKKEFTVVGFIKDNFIGDGTYFTGATILDTLNENEKYNIFFTVIDKKNKVKIAHDKLISLSDEINYDNDAYSGIEMYHNNELLALKGETSYVGINNVIKYIVIFVLAVIVFATIFLIYNAINISVTERISHFGVLRSIGATPKQVRNLVLKESLIMCLISIPFGVIFGYLGVWTTVKILGVKITNMIGDGTDAFMVKFYPSIIIFTTILGIITILIASFGPARNAGKISPINIIKGKGKSEKIKYYNGKLIKKIFGIEGWIAYKNIRKNSKRFIVTILSLSISLIMFITFTTLNMKRIDELSYINKATLAQGEIYVYEEDAINKIEDKLKEINGIEMPIYQWFETYFPLVLDSSVITDEFKSIYGSRYSEYDNEQVKISTFNKEILNYIGIKEELKENEVVLVNNITRFDDSGKLSKVNITNLKEGDTLKIPKVCIDYIINIEGRTEEEAKKLESSLSSEIDDNEYYEFKIKKIIDKNPFNPEYSYAFEIAVSKDFMKLFREGRWIGGDKLGFRYTNAENDKEVIEIAKEVKKLTDNYDCGFFDNTEYNRRTEEMWTVVNVFVYGFIVMVSLIGIVNVINTISLNILLKKKEFGTLGTIGMDSSQLYKMIVLEGLLHGIISCIIGGIIAVGLSFIAIKIVSYGFTFGNTLYWQPFVIGFAINLVVVIIASLIPLNKLKKMSLVETIRNVE